MSFFETAGSASFFEEEDVESGEDVESIEESGSANSTALTFLMQ